jgi:hypothetical protein
VCEVDYGLHPAFRRHPSDNTPHWLHDGASRSGDAAGYTARGELLCTRHRKPMVYDEFERPGRQGLLAGQRNDERRFRVRATCEHGRPARSQGDERLERTHALPQPQERTPSALRNAPGHARPARPGRGPCFSALKGAHVGAPGADRMRLKTIDTFDAITSLAHLSRAALVVADQRQQHGVGAHVPPRPASPAGGRRSGARRDGPSSKPQPSTPTPKRSGTHGPGQQAISQRSVGPKLGNVTSSVSTSSTANFRAPLSVMYSPRG